MRWGASGLAVALIVFASGATAQGAHDDLIAKHAAANDVPEALVRRIITIESRGNPSVVSKGNYGLMQIRLGTARAMGYDGNPQGLLDADTNMKYAVKYLAGAYRAAGCDHNLAVAYYQRGYARAGKARCGTQAQFVVAQAETRPAKPPAAKDAQDTALAQSASKSKPEQDSSADVLKPKVVQTVPIPGRGSKSAATPAAQPVERDVAPTNPQPNTFAARMMVTTAGLPPTTDARANIEPEAIPLPQARKSGLSPAPKQEVKPAGSKVKKHASSTKPKRADKTEGSGNLISMLKSLVTSEKKPPARKRKADARPER